MRKYWLGIAVAGALAVLSGCGAGNSSKSSANEMYVMETAAQTTAAAMDMEYAAAGMPMEGEAVSADTAAGVTSGADQNCQHGR